MPKSWVRLSCRIPRSDDLTFLWDHHPRAEGIFWRLLAVTDDFGRMEYDPRFLKADLLPLSSKPQKVFAECIAVLAERGMVFLYEARGKQYLQITNYDLYQEDQAWTRIKATCPPPPDWVPPPGLVAFLHDAKDKSRFYPERYGLVSNGDGSYRTVTNGNESGPPHLTSQHLTPEGTQGGEAPPAASPPPPDRGSTPAVNYGYAAQGPLRIALKAAQPLIAENPREMDKWGAALLAAARDPQFPLDQDGLIRELIANPPSVTDTPKSWLGPYKWRQERARDSRGPKAPDTVWEEKTVA